MKKNIFIIFIFLGINIINAQKEPTEKDIFKFIYYQIKNESINNSSTDLKLQNVKFDIENMVIEYEKEWEGNPPFKVTEKKIIDFKNIESVEIKFYDRSKTIKYLKSIGVESKTRSYWGINVKFKEKSVKNYGPPSKNGFYNNKKDIKWNDGKFEIFYTDNVNYVFTEENKNNAEKLFKALQYLIKIRTGVNLNLFDN